MRTRVLGIVLAMLSLVPVGCAGGFRIGGNRFGAGIGAYIGPVPDVLRPDDSCQPQYTPPGVVTLPPPEQDE
jgi:hypothetical protein